MESETSVVSWEKARGLKEKTKDKIKKIVDNFNRLSEGFFVFISIPFFQNKKIT
jgi:hypothetical protein